MLLLVELSLGVLTLGVIVGVALPKVVRYINRGKNKCYEAELD